MRCLKVKKKRKEKKRKQTKQNFDSWGEKNKD